MKASFVFIFICIILLLNCGQKSPLAVSSYFFEKVTGAWSVVYTEYNDIYTVTLRLLKNNTFELIEEVEFENYYPDYDTFFSTSINKEIFYIIRECYEFFITYHEINGEGMEQEVENDTIIFWLDDFQLEISRDVLSMKQISGEKNTLINSTFYSMDNLYGNIYRHFLYEFTENSFIA